MGKRAYTLRTALGAVRTRSWTYTARESSGFGGPNVLTSWPIKPDHLDLGPILASFFGKSAQVQQMHEC